MATVDVRRMTRLREQLQLTKTDLARIAGVSQSHISQIELGRINSIGSATLLALAIALETNTDYLVGASDDPRPPKAQAIGRIKPDEEALLRTYRLIVQDNFKHAVREHARMLADLDDQTRREARQAARQSQSAGRAGRVDGEAAPE